MTNLSTIQQNIVACNDCERLRTWCKKVAVEKRKSFLDDTYWGKPVPSFGDTNAQVLIVGLAPAAHGANRTGRMFTGDNSGLWLYRALYEHGFSNRENSQHSKDDLVLTNVYITAVVHCAPPDNKPSKDELNRCSQYLDQELMVMKNMKVIVALGSIAWNALFEIAKDKYFATPSGRMNWISKKEKFGHGVVTQLGPYTLIGSYHPSQQNTFTKRLTKEMFDNIFTKVKKLIE